MKPEIKLFICLIFSIFLIINFYVGFGFHDDIAYTYLAYLLSEGKLKLPDTNNIFSFRLTVYFPIALFYKIFSINEYSTSLPFILYSIGTIFATYQLGKILFNENVGLFAGILLSVLPLFLFYTTQYGPDIPVTFFITCSMLFFVKAEKEQKHEKNYFISGLFLGFAYLTKITFVAFVIALLFLINKKFFKNKKKLIEYSFILFGFLLCFIPENIYYYIQTGDWLVNIKSNFKTYYQPLNPNPDTLFYLKAVLGFILIDDFNFFGFLFYIFFISLLTMIKKQKRNLIYLIVWVISSYLSLEFLFPFFTSVGAIEKDVRFLIIILPPVVITIGKFLENVKKASNFLFLVIFLLLIIPSLYFSWDCTTYVRAGMGDIREVYNFLKNLPEKNIYSHIGYNDRLKFFFSFNDSINLIPYNCFAINCSSENYNMGKYIHDAYIILDPDCYTIYNKKEFPAFVYNPPRNWILLKTIEIIPPTKHNYLCLFEFNPKIYYAP